MALIVVALSPTDIRYNVDTTQPHGMGLALRQEPSMGEERHVMCPAGGMHRPHLIWTALALGVAVACSAPEQSPTPPPPDSNSEARARMVADGIIGWGIEDQAVIETMGRVPRHVFVPDEYLDQAYENHPLPIGYGQTISQPYIVALMTQEADLEPGERVLEVGTGSGYQAAVLADLGATVFTIELIAPLADAAARRLTDLGYANVKVRHADGYLGWPEESPFEAIIVTAAPDHVPQPLLAQLKVGGVLVIPVGPVGGYQELWRIQRVAEERYESSSLGGVRFVPLLREEPEEAS